MQKTIQWHLVGFYSLRKLKVSCLKITDTRNTRISEDVKMFVLRHVTSLQILAENSFSGAEVETSDGIRNEFNAKMVAGTFNDTEQEQFITFLLTLL